MDKMEDIEKSSLEVFSTLKKTSNKFFVVVLLILLVIFSSLLLAARYKEQIKSEVAKLEVFWQSQLVPVFLPQEAVKRNEPSATSPKQSEESYANIFYANLEYDPQNGQTTQLEVGKLRGEPPQLSPELPKLSNDNIAYKIEVVSENGDIVEAGWLLAYKELITTKRGTWLLKIGMPYKPQSFIKVYLENGRLIWTVKMV